MGDAINILYGKLEPWLNPNAIVVGGTQLPADSRNGRIFVDINGIRRTIRKMPKDWIRNLRGSNWHREGFDEAVYFDDGHNQIQVWSGTGQITSGVTCESITGIPALAYWGYVIVNEVPMYNAATSVNFQLHSNDQPDLVNKILVLAGISIEEEGLTSIASNLDQLSTQQENKN